MAPHARCRGAVPAVEREQLPGHPGRARGDHASTAVGFLEAARLDPCNAVGSLSEAVFAALLARDADLAAQVILALRETRSHAALGRLAARLDEAGIAALDGQTGTARAGLLDAYAGFRDVEAARRQAITGLVMATLLGPGDGQVRAAIAESRRLFEQMGAGLWLARLDATEAGSSTAPAMRSTLSRQAVPADRG